MTKQRTRKSTTRRRTRPYTPSARTYRILADAKDGMTDIEIAKKYNNTVYNVRSMLERHGISVKSSTKKCKSCGCIIKSI